MNYLLVVHVFSTIPGGVGLRGSQHVLPLLVSIRFFETPVGTHFTNEFSSLGDSI